MMSYIQVRYLCDNRVVTVPVAIVLLLHRLYSAATYFRNSLLRSLRISGSCCSPAKAFCWPQIRFQRLFLSLHRYKSGRCDAFFDKNMQSLRVLLSHKSKRGSEVVHSEMTWKTTQCWALRWFRSKHLLRAIRVWHLLAVEGTEEHLRLKSLNMGTAHRNTVWLEKIVTAIW